MKTILPFKITIILDKINPVAQVENMEQIIVDGEVINSKLLPAESLLFPLSEEILGKVTSESISRIKELEDELAERPTTESLAEKDETIAALRNEIEVLKNPKVVGGVSKLTIMRRLQSKDKWDTFKLILSGLPEEVQDAWTLAQEIRHDDPMFVENADGLKAALGLTDEEFSLLLKP